jgi:acyl-CoA thioester hydrolase
MPAVYEHPRVVQPSEIDALGHANNIAYLAWLQEAALAHSAAQGWPGDRYHAAGAGFVVRAHHITYYRPALPGDALIVRTWVATFRKATSLRRYDVLRPADGKLLASAATDWAYVNFRTGLPTRIPHEVSSAFELVTDAADRYLAEVLGRAPAAGGVA